MAVNSGGVAVMVRMVGAKDEGNSSVIAKGKRSVEICNARKEE
jgi:hypothetical protein